MSQVVMFEFFSEISSKFEAVEVEAPGSHRLVVKGIDHASILDTSVDTSICCCLRCSPLVRPGNRADFIRSLSMIFLFSQKLMADFLNTTDQFGIIKSFLLQQPIYNSKLNIESVTVVGAMATIHVYLEGLVEVVSKERKFYNKFRALILDECENFRQQILEPMGEKQVAYFMRISASNIVDVLCEVQVEKHTMYFVFRIAVYGDDQDHTMFQQAIERKFARDVFVDWNSFVEWEDGVIGQIALIPDLGSFPSYLRDRKHNVITFESELHTYYSRQVGYGNES